jgi:hypothetical protein
MSPERSVHKTVTHLVRGQFLPPKHPVAFGISGVERTSVPETTINKYSNLQFRENEIGAAKNTLPSPPTGDAMHAENANQRKFRIFVPAPTDAGHYL